MVCSDWEDNKDHSYFEHLVTHNKMTLMTKSLIQEQMLRNLWKVKELVEVVFS